jgi:amino acid transporter
VAKDGKFGTFGGVFTPSILTILGVIMYLRLPWVVGNAGLYAALGIILVAHVISVCTGLSISSIATDKKVGAGGPYYIVSRSLGLPIGGTLGLALFVGLAFSVSLYVIGFSESFLGFIHVTRSLSAIRIAGTITIVVITVVTFVSTAFAIKTQYLILLFIALSLASIFLGPHHAHAAVNLAHAKGGPSLAVLFGVFFPAVTGFTAGVNMSGDLRDPKKSIPRGTMAAIAVGLVVYVALAVFLAWRVPAHQLVRDQDLLLHVALFAPFVVAGIWGATLSSALGSILGAPRILQALSSDHIGPRWFARGYGKTNEPRNALLFAFAIAEGGILIGRLDAIARVVSMVFLATYGFLNLCCAIESWASPDFRPSFRIPRGVSVVGALTSLLVMIELDLLAMAGAVALMAGLFVYLERKQLELEAGDAWAGIWSSMIRSGLARLSRETERQRNWRPTVLAFHEAGDAQYARQRRVTAALIAGNGIATDFELGRASGVSEDEARAAGEDDARVGLFSRALPSSEPFEAIENLCRYHGFAALRPNTLLVPWSLGQKDAARFARVLDGASELGLNALVYAPTERDVPRKPRIDVWWRAGAGNLAFCAALLRFVTRARDYERASVRLLLASTDSADNDYLRTSARRVLRETRIQAAIRVVDVSDRDRPFDARVREESMDAALVVLGLPNNPADTVSRLDAVTNELVEELADVLFFRAAPEFEDAVTLGRPAAVSFVPPPLEGGERELPAVTIPENADLARAVSEALDAEQQRATALFERGVKRVYAAHVALVRRVAAAVDRHLSPFARAGNVQNPRKLRHAANRAESALLLECREQLEHFEHKELAELTAALSSCIDAFVADAKHSIGDDELEVLRRREDFVPRAGDSTYVRRFKRRRRFFAWFKGGDVKYRVPAGDLLRFYRHKAIVEVLGKALARLERDTHQLVIHLGKIVASQAASGADATALTEALAERERRLSERLDEVVARAKDRVAVQQWSLLVGSRQIADQFARDVVRLDVAPLVKKSRRASKSADADNAALAEMPERWSEHQRHLIGRGMLGLGLCTFQERLASIVARNKDAIALELQNGVLSDSERLRVALVTLKSSLGNGGRDKPRLEARVDLKSRFNPGPAIDNLVRETAEPVATLPETVQTLTDESIQRLEEGRFDEVETIELPVRRLAQFLVDSELIGAAEEQLGELPLLEQRVSSVAQDVFRLIGFQIAEAQTSGEEVVLEQLVTVVDSSLERLDAELTRLRDALPELSRAFDAELGAVVEATSAWDLVSRAANLEQHIRLRQGKKAVSGVRGAARRALEATRRGAVGLVYRKSAGVLLARRLEAKLAPEGAVVDHVRAFVEQNTPSAEVLEALPFYYRQLFMGQSAVSEAFWVDRESELAKAKRALAAARRGASGALIITGPRGSGKSALCLRVTSELGARARVCRVQARPGGSIDLDTFDAALARATSLDGASAGGEIPDGATLVFDDVELWWERSPGGLAVLERIARLIDEQGHRCRFILCASRPALALIDRLQPLSDRALGVVDCAPMPALALKNVVTLRHASSGMKFELGSKGEDSLGELGLAQLFSRHFDYSSGWVGPALRSWLTHVARVKGDTLSVRRPERDHWEVIDELGTESVALLVQLALHKQLTFSRLARLSRLDERSLRAGADTLERTNLVVESHRGVLEMNPFVQHVVLERFSERELLP